MFGNEMGLILLGGGGEVFTLGEINVYMVSV